MVTEGERLTLSIPEAAKVFGISRGLAYDLARRDKLPVPVIRLGRRMVLSRKAVEALLSGNGEVSHAND
jgi:excisionase family DNA binding protein